VRYVGRSIVHFCALFIELLFPNRNKIFVIANVPIPSTLAHSNKKILETKGSYALNVEAKNKEPQTIWPGVL
jgi:hypothetical protein